MHKVFSKKRIDDYRRQKWRVQRASYLRTPGQMTDFLDEVGMCLLFACRDIPLPKLYDCAADDVNWWSWKDVLQERKLAYNGRLVRRKATLVSMQLLPAFYAVYLSGGGYTIFEEEYYWGKLGQLANEVAESLDRNGPTPVDVLRAKVVPSGKEHTRRFHSALLELQSKFKIVTVGLKDKSWGVRILDLFVNWVPLEVERAVENMTREEAMRRICLAFLNTAGACPERRLPGLFGWTTTETSRQVEDLAAAGLLRRGRIRGKSDMWLSIMDD